MKPIVFSFGCPRSGTTFMQQALAKLKTPLTEKIGEGSLLHPCRSHDGLRTLSHLFASRPVVFVRTVRHPVEIAASFVAARHLTEEEPESFSGLAKNSDADVLRFVRSESVSVADQREHFAETDWPHELIEVRYEDLSAKDYREIVASKIVSASGVTDKEKWPLIAKLDTFGVRPTRPGRLSHGVDPITSKHRAEFAHQLADVIQREGYE